MTHKRIKKSFEKWRLHEVREEFGLTFLEKSELLEKWIKAPAQLPEDYAQFIEKLRLRLNEMQHDWNEMELIMNFIAPFLSTLNFEGKNYNCFANRPLKALTENYELYGMVDWFIATGTHEPQKPYFFIHEYKRFGKFQADPLGQLLIEMVASQLNNKDKKAIYGCFVVGSNWNFVILDNNYYTKSHSYDAFDTVGIAQIWAILNHTKTLIEGYLITNK